MTSGKEVFYLRTLQESDFDRFNATAAATLFGLSHFISSLASDQNLWQHAIKCEPDKSDEQAIPIYTPTLGGSLSFRHGIIRNLSPETDVLDVKSAIQWATHILVYH
jgi:hypothetical protein